MEVRSGCGEESEGPWSGGIAPQDRRGCEQGRANDGGATAANFSRYRLHRKFISREDRRSSSSWNLTPCILDLVGENPTFVDHLADLKLVADRIVLV
mmetsp:Transcript_9944/g.22200  ORF Transcript_9944/g.22200 Transcript_9944/m.22200 type:complete len:97 (-) Transcript_9944:847-1137(-)